MSDYFEEMGWQPLGPGETPNNFIHLARLLRDFSMFEELGETVRLAPAASKEVVENLPKITVDKGGNYTVSLFKMTDFLSSFVLFH